MYVIYSWFINLGFPILLAIIMIMLGITYAINEFITNKQIFRDTTNRAISIVRIITLLSVTSLSGIVVVISIFFYAVSNSIEKESVKEVKQELISNHYLLQELVSNSRLLPKDFESNLNAVITIDNLSKSDEVEFSVTFDGNQGFLDKLIIPSNRYLKGKLKNNKLNNIQIVNEDYLELPKLFKKVANEHLSFYKLDFTDKGLEGITTNNKKLTIQLDAE